MPRGADDPTSWEQMAATLTPGRRFRSRTPPAVEPIPEPMPNARSSRLAVVPDPGEVWKLFALDGPEPLLHGDD